MNLNIQLFAAPTITFVPVDKATEITTAAPTITATFSAAVRNIDDSAITNAMLPDMVDFKLTDGDGEDVDCTMSINAEKTAITIVPKNDLAPDTDYYVGILKNLFENTDGDVVVAANATFTTSDEKTLSGTSIGHNEIVTKALVAGDVDGNIYVSQANDEKTIIVAYNSSADTAYDLTVKAPVLYNYAGKDLPDIVKEIPFGQVAVISVESARYTDTTSKINVDVENAAIKIAVFYRV